MLQLARVGSRAAAYNTVIIVFLSVEKKATDPAGTVLLFVSDRTGEIPSQLPASSGPSLIYLISFIARVCMTDGWCAKKELSRGRCFKVLEFSRVRGSMAMLYSMLTIGTCHARVYSRAGVEGGGHGGHH